ncbi:MAG: SRPBCC domain-containing protein [Bacteroidales bacterium]|nr:SRPBCC domain-containing protein [Bacteroidales bacterium]
MNPEREPVIVEYTFAADIQTVWNSITVVEQMRQWFFENIESFRPEAGFETQFMVHSGGRNFLHQWKITDVETLKRIIIHWTYDGFPGNSNVRFELSGEGRQTQLRILHQGIESFPQDIPEFSRDSCRNGWEYFIGNRLKEYLERIPD